MAKFIHSVLSQDATVIPTEVVTLDLPVNPLSHILLTLRFAQNLADLSLTFANIAAMIDRIEVLFKGSAVYSMSGIDTLATSLFINNFESWGVNAAGDDDDLRSFTFLIPLTRSLYDPNECFQRSTRGELQLQITYASIFTQIDAASQQIETIELPDASPSRFLKQTTLSVTPTATGQLDINLPIGNPISDLVLFGATIPVGSTATTTINSARILVDNIQEFYALTNFETLHNSAGRLRAAPGYWAAHDHRLLGAIFGQFDDTSAVIPENHILSNHLHMGFDVTHDGLYILETAGKSDVIIRIDTGDTGAVRVIPAEVVGV